MSRRPNWLLTTNYHWFLHCCLMCCYLLEIKILDQKVSYNASFMFSTLNPSTSSHSKHRTRSCKRCLNWFVLNTLIYTYSPHCTVIPMVKNCPKNQILSENMFWASIYPSQVIEVYFNVKNSDFLIFIKLVHFLAISP